LREGQEETLVAGHAVQESGLLAAERALVRVVSHVQAGQVGDAFAQSQFAIDLLSRNRP